MNTLLGSGGSTKESGSASTAPSEWRLSDVEIEPVELRDEQPADEHVGKTRRSRGRTASRCSSFTSERPDGVGRDRAVDDVMARVVGDVERLGEQVLQVEDLDAAVAQHVGERVVLAAGAVDPHHVVEEEVVPVGGGETLEAQTPAGARAPCGACPLPNGRRTAA